MLNFYPRVTGVEYGLTRLADIELDMTIETRFQNKKAREQESVLFYSLGSSAAAGASSVSGFVSGTDSTPSS